MIPQSSVIGFHAIDTVTFNDERERMNGVLPRYSIFEVRGGFEELEGLLSS